MNKNTWLSFIHLLLYCAIPVTHSNPCNNRDLERREHGIDLMPYLAYLEMDNIHLSIPEYVAAGIIIDRTIILTRAYHCEVAPLSSFRVLTGETFVFPKGHFEPVDEYRLHPARRDRKTYGPGFDRKVYQISYDMDFCLLRLRFPLQWNQNRQMAPLPAVGEDLIMSTTKFVSGWGPFWDRKTIQGRCRAGTRNEEYRRSPPFYHMAPVETTDRCRKALMEAKIILTDSMFCLGYWCKDFHTAQGDPGGPVFDIEVNKVVGMVVNIREWDNNFRPQLNMKLEPAVAWINQVRLLWNVSPSPNF